MNPWQATSPFLSRFPTSRWAPRRHPAFSTFASRLSACTPVMKMSVWQSPESSSPLTTPQLASSAPRLSVSKNGAFCSHSLQAPLPKSPGVSQGPLVPLRLSPSGTRTSGSIDHLPLLSLRNPCDSEPQTFGIAGGSSGT